MKQEEEEEEECTVNTSSNLRWYRLIYKDKGKGKCKVKSRQEARGEKESVERLRRTETLDI